MGIKFLAAVLILFTTPAWASCGSRGFGSTLGAGTTDKIVTTYTAAPGVTSSFAAWVWIRAAGGPGSNGKLVDKTSGSNGFEIDDNSGTTSIRYLRFWTSSTGQWSMPSTSGVWEHVCITYDASSALNSPVMYLNGVSQTVTVIAPGIGAATNVGGIALDIGNRAANDRTLDGKIADVAYWADDILTADDCSSLAHHTSPLRIHRATLTAYWPICGNGGEPDYGPSHFLQTITGTAAQLGPPTSGDPFQGVTGQ